MMPGTRLLPPGGGRLAPMALLVPGKLEAGAGVVAEPMSCCGGMPKTPFVFGSPPTDVGSFPPWKGAPPGRSSASRSTARCWASRTSPCMKRQRGPYGQRPVRAKERHALVL